jgi:hypothetical protein
VNQSCPADSPESWTKKDVGVLEPGGKVDLALEALGAKCRGQVGMQHLERDRPVVLQVMGEIDRGHATAPELALEPVALLESLSQGGWQGGPGLREESEGMCPQGRRGATEAR